MGVFNYPLSSTGKSNCRLTPNAINGLVGVLTRHYRVPTVVGTTEPAEFSPFVLPPEIPWQLARGLKRHRISTCGQKPLGKETPVSKTGALVSIHA